MAAKVWRHLPVVGGLAVVGLAVVLSWRGVGTAGQAVPWIQEHPWAAAGVVGAAGFADGLNPCAFATLLLFIGAVLAIVGQAAQQATEGARRRYVWTVSGAYMLGTFVLYFGLGLGALQLAWFRPLGSSHFITRAAGLLAVLLGVLMVREFFVPDTRVRVTMPAALHGAARRWTRQTTVGAAFVGGVIIGLCTVPCGGGMYLATLGLLAAVPERATSLALLALYNVAFVLPLALLVLAASSRSVLTAVSRWHVRNRSQFKLYLGLAVAAAGLATIGLT